MTGSDLSTDVGMITMNEPVEKCFCLYGGDRGGKYQPLSVMRQFFQKRGMPLSPEPVFLVDSSTDRRLMDMMDRIRMMARYVLKNVVYMCTLFD